MSRVFVCTLGLPFRPTFYVGMSTFAGCVADHLEPIGPPFWVGNQLDVLNLRSYMMSDALSTLIPLSCLRYLLELNLVCFSSALIVQHKTQFSFCFDGENKGGGCDAFWGVRLYRRIYEGSVCHRFFHGFSRSFLQWDF